MSRIAARDEALQVISVVNFKGGSGKTTTSAHLAQHLALTGHRVLAIDLTPSLAVGPARAYNPNSTNPSLYEAIRYDDKRVPISKIIRKTNFPGLDIVPANLELQEFEYDTPLVASAKSPREGERFYPHRAGPSGG